MAESDREKWDEKYARKPVPDTLQPDRLLTEHAAEFEPGRALDLACGLGRNAIWLSRQGWVVDAVDVSVVGLKLARQLAERLATPSVHWIAADLDEFVPEPAAYDLILVFRFLDRDRLPHLIQRALRPGGLLIYETFLRSELDRPSGHVRNPAFTLEPGELPRLYPELIVEEYHETDSADGAVAQLVARMPLQLVEN